MLGELWLHIILQILIVKSFMTYLPFDDYDLPLYNVHIVN
jgi:hypothetical protein